VRVQLPQRPAWLEALSTDLCVQPVPWGDQHSLEIAEAPAFAILRAVVPAADLGDDAFRVAVREVYTRIGRLLRERALFPWRFWNYVPEIRKPATIGANRYQVFNAGRCEGYRDWFGEALPGRVPAASAVGHTEPSLVIDLLAGRAPGVGVENPRQVPAYRYSQRWGPFPPCFSRAMTLPVPLLEQKERYALVSGTSSVVGENSRHPHKVHAQIRETCTNLATLSAVLAGENTRNSGEPAASEAALSRFRELRLYVVRDCDVDAVATAFCSRFPAIERLEIAVADLCRDELLLEAEGVAVLDIPTPAP
jgi:hypothetical protein